METPVPGSLFPHICGTLGVLDEIGRSTAHTSNVLSVRDPPRSEGKQVELVTQGVRLTPIMGLLLVLALRTASATG